MHGFLGLSFVLLVEKQRLFLYDIKKSLSQKKVTVVKYKDSIIVQNTSLIHFPR